MADNNGGKKIKESKTDTKEASESSGLRRVLVVLHGLRAGDPDVRAAVKAVRDSKLAEVSVRVTWEAGDVEQFVFDAVKAKSADTIVAAGGDGTVTEVVAALIKCNCPPEEVAVAILPLGTSNDLASVTGIPTALEDALMLAADPDSKRRLVDVAMLNGEVFLNTSTLGACSELSGETSTAAKGLLGPAAYLVQGIGKLVEWHPIKTKLRFPVESADPDARDIDEDDIVEIEEQLLNLTAGNCRQLASMLQICPDALLDDGLLDFTYFVGTTSQNLTGMLGEMLPKIGSNDDKDDTMENLRMMRLPWLEIEAEEEMPANRDGEDVAPTKKFRYDVLPRRILFHLPDDHLLRKEADKETNPPTIQHNARRADAVHDMVANVTHFKRSEPQEEPQVAARAMACRPHSKSFLRAKVATSRSVLSNIKAPRFAAGSVARCLRC